jgi:hypothetical protein
MDFDKAGAAAVQWWRENFSQSKRWPVPQAKDPGDAFKAGLDLRAWILAGFPEGWTIGQDFSSVPSARRGGAAAAGAASCGASRAPAWADRLLDSAEAVRRLAELLAAHPQVSIYHTTRRVRLLYPMGWSDLNPQAFGDLSDLVFFGQGVIDYILEHPRRQIDAGNIVLKEDPHEKA